MQKTKRILKLIVKIVIFSPIAVITIPANLVLRDNYSLYKIYDAASNFNNWYFSEFK